MKKKKGKNNAVKKFPIYKGLIVFAVIFLAMLVFLNNKYDIISYSIKDNSQAYSALSEEESSTEDEITYKIADDDTDESEIITAEDVKNNPAKYYGKVVETGGEQGDLTEDYEWQIFYSDGTNIYLISTDCINYQDAPSKNEVKISHNSSSSFAQNCYWDSSLYSCYDGYLGVSNYEHSNDYHWNFLLCGRYQDEKNTNVSMKCVSYMLDHAIWENKLSQQFQSGVVEYIIGGPTIEQFCYAYNDYHNSGACSTEHKIDLGCYVESSNSSGYVVSTEGKGKGNRVIRNRGRKLRLLHIPVERESR